MLSVLENHLNGLQDHPGAEAEEMCAGVTVEAEKSP
jgi:hypothetical protein